MIISESLQIAVLAAAHHIEMVRTADECDTFRTGFDEVLRGFLRCHISISYHLRELVFQTAAGEEYKRYGHLMKLFEMRIVYGILRQTGNDAFHVHIEEVVECHYLSLIIFMTVGTDNGITVFGCIIFYTIENGSIVVGHQIRDDDTYHARCFLAEALRKRVRSIIEFLGQIFDLLGHFLTHFVAIAQSP